MTRVEHRSGKTDHLTPPLILDRVRKIAPIGLDPASCDGNPTGAKVFLTPARDGLARPWTNSGLVFLNPPYGRRKRLRCKEWVEKAILESVTGAEIIMLLPARTDTLWFQSAMRHARAIVFVLGRITFIGEADGAPFPSALVYLGDGRNASKFRGAFGDLGELTIKVFQVS